MEEEAEESQRVVPFQLQFDKPVASKIKIAEWNPEKDLLAMVTDDSKILLHRFNWQRLWTISPGKCVTSLCWRPDGKALAVGLGNGTISLHDVENGKLLKTLKFHAAPVTCLNWEEDGNITRDDPKNFMPYEDRTSRFFPPAPRAPRMPGVVSGDSGFMDENDDSYRELSNSSYQRFNILCSGDKDGVVCFTIFGIFPIGKINIHELSVPSSLKDEKACCEVQSPSIHMISLSKDLCRLIVMCSGELGRSTKKRRSKGKAILEDNDLGNYGMHCLVLDTSIFCKRKKELHQLAQQASNIEELTEVIRTSLSVMCKQWCDAMQTFHGKFDSVSSLIADHALDSSPQEEFLSLLCGARISPAIHQFLVNSLGEAGMKRVAKVISGAGKELQRIVLDHLQPAAEIIGFRMGELRGLSRWRARYNDVGLDEMLLNNATEKSGIMLVQVERFMQVLTSVEHQFSNFFTWLLRCIKQLMQEPSDQLPPYNSELVVMFLKFLYDQDPVRQLLEPSQADQKVEVDFETMQRVKELVTFGGFLDCEYLQRTLFKEFQQMSDSIKEAFLMPFSTISKKLLCVNLYPLFPLSSSPAFISTTIPMSLSYYKDDALEDDPSCRNSEDRFLDYICFEVPGQHISSSANCIGILKGVAHGLSSSEKDSFEAALLPIPADYECVDLSLYKDSQVILLLNEATATPESSGCMMSVQVTELQFEQLSRSSFAELWTLDQLKECVTLLPVDTEKARRIPHSVVSPLAVSASRGIACVFAARKRALVYILDEDEEEIIEVEE